MCMQNASLTIKLLIYEFCILHIDNLLIGEDTWFGNIQIKIK